ncbi:hypothetical protein Tco_1352348 [Tanacetum coccineum]
MIRRRVALRVPLRVMLSLIYTVCLSEGRRSTTNRQEVGQDFHHSVGSFVSEGRHSVVRRDERYKFVHVTDAGSVVAVYRQGRSAKVFYIMSELCTYNIVLGAMAVGQLSMRDLYRGWSGCGVRSRVLTSCDSLGQDTLRRSLLSDAEAKWGTRDEGAVDSSDRTASADRCSETRRCTLERQIDLEAAFEYPGNHLEDVECALSLDKLAMPPYFHRKFRMGVAIVTGCRGYYKLGTRAWVIRGIKDGTTVTAKDGTVTNFLRKFPEYKPTKGEEEILKLRSVWEKVNYDISDSDSDLESTAKSGPRDSQMGDTSSSGIRINA